jgi:hypothetical protein
MGTHVPFALAQVLRSSSERQTGNWQAIHILGEACPCSRRVAGHLRGRKTIAGLTERVLQVGDSEEVKQLFENSSWRWEHRTAEEVRDAYGAQSAPLLIVIDPQGRIRYRGGYSARSDSRDGFHDAEIWTRVRRGENVAPLPAYGCALIFGCELSGVQKAIASLGWN